MTSPTLNVVICTHGVRPLLARTLESLAGAARPAGFGRFIVVENGSDAGARQTCDKWRERLPLKYHHLDRASASLARQYGADQTHEGLVVFLDDDIRAEPGLLTAYAQAAQREESKAFFGGPLRIDYERRPPDWLLPHMGPSIAGWEPKDPAHPLSDDLWFLGANFAVFYEDLKAVGGFNLQLGPGAGGTQLLMMEEVELQQRLLAAGCRPVYVPGAGVWHYVAAEQTTPQWTLQRHYRIWLSHAYIDGPPETPGAGPTWHGAPRWMWRRLLALRFRAWTTALVAGPQRRFKARAIYHQWRGKMEGLRLRAMQKFGK